MRAEVETVLFDAVLFDLDGVLVDSEPIIGQTWQAVLTEHGLTLESDQLRQLSTGKSFDHTLSGLQTEHGWQAPAGFHTLLGQRFNAAFKELQPIEGAKETLLALRQFQIPFAVASNSARSRLHLKLRVTGLAELVGLHAYDPSWVDDKAKPLPDLYEFAARQLEVPPSRCLVIEDSVTGVMAGTAAGASVWGLVAGGHLHPGSPAELRQAGAGRVLSSHLELRQRLGIE